MATYTVNTTKLKNTLWGLGDLSWKLHDGQLEIYNDVKKLMIAGQKEFALRIARQYGKSYLTVILALEMCIKNKSVIVRILGPSLDSISKIVDDNLQPIIADAPKGLINKHKSDKRYNLSNGSSLRIGTLERAHIDATARGGNAYAIFCEECGASVKSEDLRYAIQSVINPQLLHSSKKKGGGILGYITTPSETIDHYFHTDIEPPLIQSGAYFCRTVYDNPLLNEEQIQLAMKRCGGEQSEAWQREYLCKLFRSDVVTVVPEFNQDIHVKDFTLPIYKRLQTVIDFGGSRDCTEALIGCYDYNNKQLLIWDEMFAQPQTTTVEMVQAIQDKEAFDTFGPVSRFADMPGLISVDLNQTLKFICSQTLKDDASGSLQALRNAFYNNEIIIHPRCVKLIRTLSTGRWNKSRTDYQRTGELGHCDAIDALIYFLRNLDKQNPKPQKDQYDTCGRRLNSNGFEKLANIWK